MENKFRLPNKPAVRNAFLLGGLCSISYLAVYIARNVLGAVTPQMTESGAFTTEGIGSLSSIYFITYAVGQLINGWIGDRIKAKYMLSAGLIMAGVCNLLFSLFAQSWAVAYCAYALTGFFLSMIYGPMTKVVSENTEPIYATRCSLGYTFASFFGSPLAGVLAVVLSWQSVFLVSSSALFLMGGVCFISFSVMERKGIVTYGKFKKARQKGGNIKVLFERQIVKFTLISMITGVVRTTVVFWLPTYTAQYLGFSSEKAAMIFTVSTLVISFTAFIAIFVYERLGRNLDLTVLLSFIASTVFFLLVFFVKQPSLNIVFLVLAILTSNCAASMLWSRYCPSLYDTGMVSTATGFLDFVSYMAASISSTLFANSVSTIGWNGLILIWFGLVAFGVIVSLPFKRAKKS